MQLLIVLGLISFATARVVDWEEILEDYTAYGYLSKIGAPLAEEIRKAEENLALGRIVGGSPSSLGEHPYQVKPIQYFHALLYNITIISAMFRQLRSPLLFKNLIISYHLIDTIR